MYMGYEWAIGYIMYVCNIYYVPMYVHNIYYVHSMS